MYRQKKCRHTHYRCIRACPDQALHIARNGSPYLEFDRSTCDHCDSMDCVKACLNEALAIAGRYYTVDELMRILARDQGFWGSQGGVTFSGGEPLFQKEFILEVLKRCRSNYIHTAVETSAHVDTDFLLEILRWTDWMFIDIKQMDSAAHRAEAGVGNELILTNIAAVASSGWDGRLIIRVPIIPGYNDSVENLQAIVAFMIKLNLKEVNLLPFHRLGNSKYEQLGLEYKYAHLTSPSKEIMLTNKYIFEAAGLQCYVDFATPF
jgi:pyruvate formate lyase activating enzyme